MRASLLRHVAPPPAAAPDAAHPRRLGARRPQPPRLACDHPPPGRTQRLRGVLRLARRLSGSAAEPVPAIPPVRAPAGAPSQRRRDARAAGTQLTPPLSARGGRRLVMRDAEARSGRPRLAHRAAARDWRGAGILLVRRSSRRAHRLAGQRQLVVAAAAPVLRAAAAPAANPAAGRLVRAAVRRGGMRNSLASAPGVSVRASTGAKRAAGYRDRDQQVHSQPATAQRRGWPRHGRAIQPVAPGRRRGSATRDTGGS
mmetsp:Transcript_38088/g.122464  ORF Transcript_38088/g.122464 Transcript_38088/m.122464 type:complete len:256 (-) Transcript_38088:1490-2257(-)